MIDFPPNDRGERPIHFAIKGNQVELVRQIVAEMKDSNSRDINILDYTHNTLLHYAAALGSSEIAAILIQAGIDLDHRNTRGETALHYAAAHGKINMMLDLVRSGADLKILDGGGRAPLGLFISSVKEKDPLAVNETQLVLAALTALYWLTQAAKQSNWKIPYLEIIIPSLFVATTAFEFNYLLNNLKSTQKQLAAIAMYFVFGYLPPVNLGYHLWRTTYLVKEAFSTLGATWNNFRYRKKDTICKLAVTGTNTASAIHGVYNSIQVNKYLYDLYQSGYFSDLLNQINDFKDKIINFNLNSAFKVFLALLEEIFGFKFHYQQHRDYDYQSSSYDQSHCQTVDPSKYANNDNTISILKRITSKELDVKCSEHAAIILSPTFDRKAFCKEVNDNLSSQNTERLNVLKRAYKKVSLAAHPDKLKFDEVGKVICNYTINPDACFIKITEAKETLEKELREQVYCK
jgi:hypothetical protein